MTKAEAFTIAKPILFNTQMVQAIQNGKKTMTRRVIKPRSKNAYGFFIVTNVSDGTFAGVYDYDEDENAFDNPQKEPYKVGDILYVRETWKQATCDPAGGGYALTDTYLYKVDEETDSTILAEDKWHPSIHMPKEAARIFLRVTNVRIEKLQDIITDDYRTPANINAEGLYDPCLKCTHHNGDCKDFICEKKCKLVDSYIRLWNSTIKDFEHELYGWDANPWVRTVEFEKIEVTT